MSKLEISAQTRDTFGKGSARQLRRDGRVPAVVYGDENPVRHISLDSHDLEQALRVAQVVLEVDIDGDTVNTAPLDTSIFEPVPSVINEFAAGSAVLLAYIPYPPCAVPVEIIFPLLFMFIVPFPYNSGVVK